MKGIPLVVTNHSLLNSVSAIVKKNLSILYMDKEVKKVFTTRPMVSLHIARNCSYFILLVG